MTLLELSYSSGTTAINGTKGIDLKVHVAIGLPLPLCGIGISEKANCYSPLICVKSLLSKRIAVHVIAVLLPEPSNVALQEFESPNPLH